MATKYNDMAKNYKELSNKLKKDPLTTQEFKIVDEIEKYVDKEIEKQFKGGLVSIDLLITNFDYNPITKQVTSLIPARRDLMRKELDKRYKAAGWKIKVEYDDGLDGPNMSGPDLWILSGK